MQGRHSYRGRDGAGRTPTPYCPVPPACWHPRVALQESVVAGSPSSQSASLVHGGWMNRPRLHNANDPVPTRIESTTCKVSVAITETVPPERQNRSLPHSLA